MSTATATATSSNITHLPHTAHPIPLREQAFALHCQGLRSPAIAAELGVSERTIRSWIASSLDDLKDDLQLNRREQLLLAVERQHQLTAIAWQQFEAEAAARNTLLDVAMEALRAAADSHSDSPTESASHPINVRLTLPASTPAPRYLSLILQANKEANRLLGLHTLARLQLLTPETTSAPTPFTNSDIPAESATDSPLSPQGAARGVVGASGGRQGSSEDHIPAKTATALTDRDSESPAKTATAIMGVSARPQSATPHSPIKPQPWMM